MFRHWAASRLTDGWFKQLAKTDSQSKYDHVIDELTNRPQQLLALGDKRALAFGRGRKLRNLLLKHILRWSEISTADRERLIGFLHVPLDEFSLIAVRKVAATGEFGFAVAIPSKPSMSFAKTPELYNQLQGVMQQIARPTCHQFQSTSWPGTLLITSTVYDDAACHWLCQCFSSPGATAGSPSSA